MTKPPQTALVSLNPSVAHCSVQFSRHIFISESKNVQHVLAMGLLVLGFAKFPMHTFKTTAEDYESWPDTADITVFSSYNRCFKNISLFKSSVSSGLVKCSLLYCFLSSVYSLGTVTSILLVLYLLTSPAAPGDLQGCRLNLLLLHPPSLWEGFTES